MEYLGIDLGPIRYGDVLWQYGTGSCLLGPVVSTLSKIWDRCLRRR
jgi:hypothetical protein